MVRFKILYMRVLIICAIVIALAGCKKQNGNGMGSDIFPNKVGDTWVYHVHDTLAEFQGPINWVDYDMTVTVTGTTILSGNISANVWVFSTPGHQDTCYAVQAGDTIKFIQTTSSIQHLARQYVYPLQLNRSWYYFDSFQKVTVDSVKTINVGGNVFYNALNFQGGAGRPDAFFYVNEWVENYVGIVKRYINPSGELIIPHHLISWELASYNLK
jgi:hypothetical protein